MQGSKKKQDSEWNTPPWLWKDVLTVLEIERFGLDPCSNPKSTVPARTTICKPDGDGLQPSWGQEGYVWLNPPYEKNISAWTTKTAEADAWVALLPAKTSTRWFQGIAYRSSLACFLFSRVRFDSAIEREKIYPPAFSSVLLFGWSQRLQPPLPLDKMKMRIDGYMEGWTVTP